MVLVSRGGVLDETASRVLTSSALALLPVKIRLSTANMPLGLVVEPRLPTVPTVHVRKFDDEPADLSGRKHRRSPRFETSCYGHDK